MRLVFLFGIIGVLQGDIAIASPSATPEEIRMQIKELADQSLHDVYANVYAPDMRVNIALEQLLLANQELIGEGDDLVLAGCRPQSCQEKAIAILGVKPKQLKAAALLSYDCKDDILEPAEIVYHTQRHPDKSPPLHCARKPTLMMYVIRQSVSASALTAERELLARLRRWGEKVGAANETIHVINCY